MRLDLVTILVADVTVTAILGCMLGFAWLQNRANRSMAWWALAHVVLTGGIAVLALGENRPGPHLNFAIALILLAYALMWAAARLFDRRVPLVAVIVGGPTAWLALSFGGLLPSAEASFAFYSLLNATYCFATAYEFWRGRYEPLMSRWPAIVLQLVMGAGFLSWVPLSVLLPVPAGASFQTSDWFPVIVLITLLGRVAMAFVVLAISKERLELRQRTDALTDPLTGLPNRRAFFRAAARHVGQAASMPQPMTALVFDLDRFKAINDRHGHAFGDRVLRLFGQIISDKLQATDVIGRIGGEEFAAILPGTDLGSAAAVAERVRIAFLDAAQTVDGVALAGTVSVGVASVNAVDCNLHSLLSRADAALYAAKQAGRNRVALAQMIHDSADGDTQPRVISSEDEDLRRLSVSPALADADMLPSQRARA